MKIIGLAGGSGSGKSTVCKLFLKNGFTYINTDEVYHRLTSKPSPCLEALTKEFGKEILNSDFSLNREKLASIVFSNDAAEKRKKLNQISHYYVLAETEKIIDSLSQDGFFGVLVDAPLLFESGFDKKCDIIISVIADEKTRISRIVKRDGISQLSAKSRIRAQISDEFLKENSHFIIVNDGDAQDLEARVQEISDKIKNC
ncbi:MAG: dephospho-CoA kinase [Clostridia bacterium]|nr:dephospho-CoA kinase [Clostridia bacterium]